MENRVRQQYSQESAEWQRQNRLAVEMAEAGNIDGQLDAMARREMAWAQMMRYERQYPGLWE